VCKETNERSYFVENQEEVDLNWFTGQDRVGICGATSTPMWLMEDVAGFIGNFWGAELTK
jgi:4-hydroxy-3-methylbut-2-en-1-yl diphosphate reductase